MGNYLAGLAGTADVLERLEGVGLPDGLAESVGKFGNVAAQTRDQVNSILGPLQTFTEQAGPDSKLYNMGKQLPMIGDFVALAPVLREANAELEKTVKHYTGLNVPLSGESWVRYLTDNGAKLRSAEDNAQSLLDAAKAESRSGGSTEAAEPVRRLGGEHLGESPSVSGSIRGPHPAPTNTPWFGDVPKGTQSDPVHTTTTDSGTGSSGGGSGGGSSRSSRSSSGSSSGTLDPHNRAITEYVADLLMEAIPQIPRIGTWRATDPYQVSTPEAVRWT